MADHNLAAFYPSLENLFDEKGGPEAQDCRPSFYVGEDLIMKSECLREKVKEGKIIKVGICAMRKKSRSKPMCEILDRLERFDYIEVVVFEESVILDEPVENWPVVDALIAFFSNGFPLEKAVQYEKITKPFMINDLQMQYVLQDRREVYSILDKECIAHPRYAVLNRSAQNETEFEFTETEDSIEVAGDVFQKPFVEKPVDAEDHNVYIYFPVAAGGGSQRLFRKIGARSSVYSAMNRVRKTGSYIYEEFMPTDGTDVKVYAVGPDYAHAEARKSPALDGKVERDKDGKEVRYPVILSAREKFIARKVSLAFKQTVCGFDLLRANGKSYVCDVNGFSFVKNSSKYYDDCAKILGTMVMRALAPQLDIPWVLGSAPEDVPVVPTTSGSMMELRCVIAVIRHGDRTPKQKMKMEVKHKKFFELFEKYQGYKNGHLKLKKPKQLQEVLDIVRFLLNENKIKKNSVIEEKKAKLEQLKLVLEMYGRFSGINRKVQIKYQPHGRPKRSSSEEDCPRDPSLVLIVKWGGELTPAGKIQAEELGKAFRTLYPGGQGEFGAPGLGFLRLHSTFRHDLKMYASDEGRVQMTAAAFAKGLLALEGELTPILVQMVKSANTNGLLDSEGEMSKHQQIVKERLKEILNQDRDFTAADYTKLAATGSISVYNAMNFVCNPRQMCEKVHEMVKEITAKIRSLKLELKARDLKLYHGESWELLIRRWAKLEKDFKTKQGLFDVSKIPDIYDCIKYDLQHNHHTLQYERAEELFNCSKALADIVIPQEYGITMEEKLQIGQSLCTPLLRKIRSDLQQCLTLGQEETTRLDSRYSKGVSSPQRFVRTRLYFTSESHIHSLLSMIRYGGLCDENKDEQWHRAMEYISATGELNYMTQIVIMMFEDPNKDPMSPERYHIELHFSPGAYTCCDTKRSLPQGHGYRTLTKADQLQLLFQNEDGSRRIAGGSMVNLKSHSLRPIPVATEELKEVPEVPDLETVSEEDGESNLKPKKCVKIIPGPKSPDPNIPEWDWGDVEQPVSKVVAIPPINFQQGEFVVERRRSQSLAEPCSPSSMSNPIDIQPVSTPKDDSDGTVRSQSLEEKRSRSLEDKDKYPSCGSTTSLFDRHYLTVQLPVADYRHRRSFSSLFAVKPDQVPGIEGFTMVPSVRALETLHNVLTLNDMDKFLMNAMSIRFNTPASSPPNEASTPNSQRPSIAPLGALHKAQSLSSSTNSSAGPSSPTSCSTPVDLWQRLTMFISDNQDTDLEALGQPSASRSASESSDGRQMDTNKEYH